MPYIYLIGAALDVLIMGTTALVAYGTAIDSRWPFTLALVAALFTWATVAFLILNPFSPTWQYMGSMAIFIPLSVIAVALLWNCRPIDTPPPPPPPAASYPKINGQFRPQTQRRTYRLRTRKS